MFSRIRRKPSKSAEPSTFEPEPRTPNRVVGALVLTTVLKITRGPRRGSCVFEDLAISGVRYETASFRGVTDQEGCFLYRPGEDVTFSLGGRVLGSIRARARVSPLEVVSEVGVLQALLVSQREAVASTNSRSGTN